MLISESRMKQRSFTGFGMDTMKVCMSMMLMSCSVTVRMNADLSLMVTKKNQIDFLRDQMNASVEMDGNDVSYEVRIPEGIIELAKK